MRIRATDLAGRLLYIRPSEDDTQEPFLNAIPFTHRIPSCFGVHLLEWFQGVPAGLQLCYINRHDCTQQSETDDSPSCTNVACLTTRYVDYLVIVPRETPWNAWPKIYGPLPGTEVRLTVLDCGIWNQGIREVEHGPLTAHSHPEGATSIDTSHLPCLPVVVQRILQYHPPRVGCGEDPVDSPLASCVDDAQRTVDGSLTRSADWLELIRMHPSLKESEEDEDANPPPAHHPNNKRDRGCIEEEERSFLVHGYSAMVWDRVVLQSLQRVLAERVRMQAQNTILTVYKEKMLEDDAERNV